MPSPVGHLRRELRHPVTVLDARCRPMGTDEAWRRTTLRDLSIGGAAFAVAPEVQVGHTLELVLRRKDNGAELTLGVEVLRLLETEPRAAGVRFLTLTPDATRWLVDALGTVIDDAAAPEVVRASEVRYDGPSVETLALSSIRLHEQSLYELLDLDPACPDGELESRAEKLIDDVHRAAQEAVGRREARLLVLHRSLIRMRPLWGNPIKRARYDLRWGYVRAEQRILDARMHGGVHPHILAGIWIDLNPDSGMQAEERVAAATTRREETEALRAAIELEPFTMKWRQRLATLLKPPTGQQADVDGAMPAPFHEAATIRGNLDDLPVRSLLLSLVDTDSDVQLELRFLGKPVGRLGVQDRHLVLASAGAERGLDALRRLVDVRSGEFQVRYAPPAAQEQHMREPLVAALRAALG